MRIHFALDVGGRAPLLLLVEITYPDTMQFLFLVCLFLISRLPSELQVQIDSQ